MDIDKENRHIPVKHLDDGDHRHRVATAWDHSRMVKEFIVVDGRIVPIDFVDDGDGPI